MYCNFPGEVRESREHLYPFGYFQQLCIYYITKTTWGSLYHGLDPFWVLATVETGSLISYEIEPILSVPCSNILGSHMYILMMNTHDAWSILAAMGAFRVHAQGKPEVPENKCLWKQPSSNGRWNNSNVCPIWYPRIHQWDWTSGVSDSNLENISFNAGVLKWATQQEVSNR